MTYVIILAALVIGFSIISLGIFGYLELTAWRRMEKSRRQGSTYITRRHQQGDIFGMFADIVRTTMPERKGTVELIITGDDEFNTFVHSDRVGGMALIQLKQGLVESATCKEIGAVIAHELGHVHCGHASRTRRFAALSVGAVLCSAAAMIGVLYFLVIGQPGAAGGCALVCASFFPILMGNEVARLCVTKDSDVVADFFAATICGKEAAHPVEGRGGRYK